MIITKFYVCSSKRVVWFVLFLLPPLWPIRLLIRILLLTLGLSLILSRGKRTISCGFNLTGNLRKKAFKWPFEVIILEEEERKNGE